jgi:hypothetical protein
VRAQHKGPEEPDLQVPAGSAQVADTPSGNEVLALPPPPPTLTLTSGAGLANTEMLPEPQIPELSAQVVDARDPLSAPLIPGVRESAADFLGRLDDLTPRLGTVQAGELSGPSDLADLRRSVRDFFTQLGSLETVPPEYGSPMGLAPWLLAAATAVAAWEFARRRWRRPVVLGFPTGDTTESLSWGRRPGSSSLSTEDWR